MQADKKNPDEETRERESGILERESVGVEEWVWWVGDGEGLFEEGEAEQ